ncbi:hypothetical protein BESB_072620 [Besnoitia besnoiti]|uniref:SURF1-like protein n=1 Tax=Besnoitia besnoiti TaxID=94643 RepID=A0A2A9MFF5_BESBE|nr:uncharacterized protein BESB_072620 [Besnoitia besnoiti]PFH34110.1 hypothetical protein BESB_072620 [Besnoitia besnoiti]
MAAPPRARVAGGDVFALRFCPAACWVALPRRSLLVSFSLSPFRQTSSLCWPRRPGAALSSLSAPSRGVPVAPRPLMSFSSSSASAPQPSKASSDSLPSPEAAAAAGATSTRAPFSALSSAFTSASPAGAFASSAASAPVPSPSSSSPSSSSPSSSSPSCSSSPSAVAASSGSAGQPSLPSSSLPFIAHGRTMPGQRLLPCSPEDVAILSASTLQYPNPQEVEGGVIVRIVRLSDPVTSPVMRSIRNRQYGIRGNERWWLLGVGTLVTSCLVSLGFWQLARMQWKHQLLEYRRAQMRRPAVWVTHAPFPWMPASGRTEPAHGAKTHDDSPDAAARQAGNANAALPAPSTASSSPYVSSSPSAASPSISSPPSAASPSVSSPPSAFSPSASSSFVSSPSDSSAPSTAAEAEEARLRAAWAYRPVVVRGVLDSSTEILVGPRPGLEPGSSGYLLVSPLRLEDGSVLLVNKGHLRMEDVKLPPFKKAETRRDADGWRTKELNWRQGRDALAEACATATGSTRLSLSDYAVSSAAHRDALAAAAPGGEAKTRDEPPGWVTVRGILEPGEIPSLTFKSLLASNRPKEGQFIFLVPQDLVDGLKPGTVRDKRATGAMVVNAYDIVYDEDVRAAQRRRQEKKAAQARRGEREGDGEEAEALSSAFSPALLASLPRAVTGELGFHDPASLVALLGLSEIPRRFAKYQQKRKDDYLLFWADEHTHFNYACQWFVMALCTAGMTAYKFIEVSRWRW